MLDKNFQKNIEILEKSPVFNLSLSSKELFHSNFIAWVAKTYPVEFGNLLAKYFQFKTEDNVITKVERESKNIDLIVEFNSEIKIIFENKVKSTPDERQLIEYKAKNNADYYVLLTLIKPAFDLDVTGWKLMRYKDMSSVVLSALSLEIDNSYHKQLIRDYIQFVDALSSLSNMMALNVEEDYFNFYGTIHAGLKRIKLHDLYLKYTYNELVIALRNKIKSELKDYEVITGQKYSHKINRNKIVINSSIMNGKGIINIDYSNEDEMIYGIMLDGERYNLYIYSWGSKLENIQEIANQLQESSKWFTFNNVLDIDVYPKNGKKFNQYGKNMLYRSMKIKTDTQLSSLLEQVIQDLRRLI